MASKKNLPPGDIRLDPLDMMPTEQPLSNEAKLLVKRAYELYDFFREQLREEHPDLVVVEQGSSYKFCLLAEGHIDHYVRTTNTYEWDTAAGELILAEAGGSTLSYPEGEPLCYNKADLRNPWFEAKSKR